MYFNTTNSKGKALFDYFNQANNQNDLILSLLSVINRPMSPIEVQEICNISLNKNWPITSIRRALTTLSNNTSETGIYKTGNKVMGAYGRPNYQWAYSASLIENPNAKVLTSKIYRKLREDIEKEEYLDV